MRNNILIVTLLVAAMFTGCKTVVTVTEGDNPGEVMGTMFTPSTCAFVPPDSTIIKCVADSKGALVCKRMVTKVTDDKLQ